MAPVTVARLDWWKVIAVMLGIALLAVACGAGGTPSGEPSPTTAPSAQATSVLCQDAAALRASLDKLTQISVGPGTADELKADLADVSEKLDTFAADAGTHFQPQASALKSALATLRTAVANLAAGPSAATVSAVVTALGGVTTAAQNLLAAVNKSCPSVAPSLSSSPRT